MPDLPIAPDESSGEPRCQRECPSWGTTDARRYSHCAHPEQGMQRVIGDLCHPRIRELVALSRRRCDGCRHSKPLQEESDVFCHLWRIRQNPGGHCNEWAAKR